MNFNKTSDPIEYGDVHKLLGDLLRRARKDKGLSGTQTAKLFNISQQQVSRYERGITKLTIEKAIDFSVLLNIEPKELCSLIFDELTHKNNFLKNNSKTCIN